MELFMLIAPILAPYLYKCFSATSSESPQEYLAAHYNAETDSFDPGLVDDAMPQTYRAIRQKRHAMSRAEAKNFKRPSRAEVREATILQLKEAMNATPKQVAACKKIADMIKDSTDLEDAA